MTPAHVDMWEVVKFLSPLVIAFGLWLIRVELRINKQQYLQDEAKVQLGAINGKLDAIQASQTATVVALARVDEQVKTLFDRVNR